MVSSKLEKSNYPIKQNESGKVCLPDHSIPTSKTATLETVVSTPANNSDSDSERMPELVQQRTGATTTSKRSTSTVLGLGGSYEFVGHLDFVL